MAAVYRVTAKSIVLQHPTKGYYVLVSQGQTFKVDEETKILGAELITEDIPKQVNHILLKSDPPFLKRANNS